MRSRRTTGSTHLRQAGRAAALGVLLLTSRDALAFCRTTTEVAPPDYDASAGGCWQPGVPLFWRNACLGYSIHRDASRKIPYDVAASVISTAFTRWTGASCPTEGNGSSRTSIDVRDLGPADCTEIKFQPNGVANQNVVVFRDDTWKYGRSVLGLTTVSYDPATGELKGADMEINTLDMEPLALTDPVAGDAYDLASVLTHEAGHFLGIAHSDVDGATMFARYDQGQTSMRNLSPDDVNAVCSIYRPDGDRSVLNGKVTQAPQCDPTPRGGYTQQCERQKAGCTASIAATPTAIDPAALGCAILGAVAIVRRRSRRA